MWNRCRDKGRVGGQGSSVWALLSSSDSKRVSSSPIAVAKVLQFISTGSPGFVNWGAMEFWGSVPDGGSVEMRGRWVWVEVKVESVGFVGGLSAAAGNDSEVRT